MHKLNKKTNYLVTGALIAAAYVGLTFLSNAFSLAYGPIQFRISEVLCLLPLFTPSAIAGVSVGCFIANIASFNLFDMLFGTLATLISACLTYFLRSAKINGFPFLSFLSPVIINAVIIGLEISFFYLPDTALPWGLIISAVEVGIGEALVLFGLGIPFYYIVKRYNIFKD